MKNLSIFRATVSAIIIWVVGVIAFVSSYFIPVMDNPDAQANWVLMLALIPAVAIGTQIYYQKGYKTNGFVLGIYMFMVTILLDACITVPVFIIPVGGNHFTFFADPIFWLIAIAYISLVFVFWNVRKTFRASGINKA